MPARTHVHSTPTEIPSSMSISRRTVLAFAIAIAIPGIAIAQARERGPSAPHRLTANDSTLLLDGRPMQIISGEMHYARIPRAYWRGRLRKAREMGLNTISSYVFWNLHEPTPGTFDFTGQNDVAEFVREAQQEGLWVILRPGPYVCAEWDLGGYPAWLLADSAMVLRSADPRFTQPAVRWLDRLGRELAPLLATHGGPIIAVQVENEYGSFDHDTTYLDWQLAALRHAGLGDAYLYTADGDVQLPRGTLTGIPAVVNLGPGDAIESFAKLHAFRPHEPLMSGEYWAGWFDQWGRKHHATDAAQQTRELDWMLGHGYSVNLYMFHGGTTFGLMNGANADRSGYNPQTTSYDYDAALDEAGHPTPKYFAFRDVIARHRPGVTLPPVESAPPMIAVAPFELAEHASLWSNLGRPAHVEHVRPMESFGQSYGYILYRTRVHGPISGELVIDSVRDYAQVYVNGELVATLDRRLKQDSTPITLSADENRIDILVENSGRVNFTKVLRGERKGITRSVTLDGRELTGWDVFTLPMTDIGHLRFDDDESTGPAFYRGTFRVDRAGDTNLDMRGWGKGLVWVNGHDLGRFWSIGPQQTLYVPGPWLNPGVNTVTVFDLDDPDSDMLRGLAAPVLDDLRPDRRQ